MLGKTEREPNVGRASIARLQERARRYRRQASLGRDRVIQQELLRLAAVYDRMAANAAAEDRSLQGEKSAAPVSGRVGD